jgi:hypothetical protein
MSIQQTIYCTQHSTNQYQTTQHTNDSTLKLPVTKICTKQHKPIDLTKIFRVHAAWLSPGFRSHQNLQGARSSAQSRVWLNIIQRKSMSERIWDIKLLPQEQRQYIIFVEVRVGQTRRQHDVQVHKKLYMPVLSYLIDRQGSTFCNSFSSPLPAHTSIHTVALL